MFRAGQKLREEKSHFSKSLIRKKQKKGNNLLLKTLRIL